MRQWFFAGFFLGGWTLVSLAQETQQEEFLSQHCSGCHDAESHKGGFDLSTLPAPTDLHSLNAWVRVYDRVKAGEMPPTGKKRPAPDVLRGFLAELGNNLTQKDIQLRKSDGRATLRRLTRVEYENAVRDLFQLPHLEVQNLFPSDGARGIYDKVGESLDFSEIQMGIYLDVADRILDQAICTQSSPPPPRFERLYPTTRKFWQALGNGDGFLIKENRVDSLFPLVPVRESGLKNRTSHPDFKNDEFVRRTDSFGLIRSSDPSKYRSFAFVAPVEGEYRLRVSAWSFMLDQRELKAHNRTEVAALWSEIDRTEHRLLGYLDAPSFLPTVSEFRRWLPARSSVRFETETVRHAEADIAEFTGPGIAVDWLEVEGPLFEQWPTASHRMLFGDLPMVPIEHLLEQRPPRRRPSVVHGPNGKRTVLDLPQMTVFSADPSRDARGLLERFLTRAFRRPVSAETVDAYVGLVEKAMRPRVTEDGASLPGDCFETAMREAYKTALCSPHFLFREETPGPLSDVALASRLALWLWSSIPDDALLESARRGELRKAAGMTRAVDRMLEDPRSDRFISDFLNQWLNLSKIDDTTPDRELYPEYSPYMKNCMVMETRAFFREIIARDLSASHVISSDFAMLNGEMARLYGIDGVHGHAVQRVSLPKESARGGFIAQAAIHKVTANGTTTSPVLRGKWFNERILGIRIPLPPPNVGSVEPDTRGAVTIREQLDKHRREESCAACHALIDPPGFAMEVFDVIGGERQRYRSLGEGDPAPASFAGGKKARFKLALPVDCRGNLPDGTAFGDFLEFRRVLEKRTDVVAKNVLLQLLEYATGSPIHFADRPEVESLVSHVREKNYGVRSMIHGIAQSELFQRK